MTISSDQFVSVITQFLDGGYPDPEAPAESRPVPPGVHWPGQGPKSHLAASDPMPSLAAQAVVSLVALQGVAAASRDEKLGAAVGGQLTSFIENYCGSTGRPPLPPPPHVLLTAVLLHSLAARLEAGSFRNGLERATSQLIERAFSSKGVVQ
jgi:hypothetical protein